MFADGDPVVPGCFVLQVIHRVPFVVEVTSTLLVMRTGVRVVNDDRLTRVPVLLLAFGDESKGLVKTRFMGFRRVPVARWTEVVDESGEP